MTRCKVKGCTNPVRARGWCSSHHNRWNRYGDPCAGSTYHGTPLKFLHEKVFKHKNKKTCLVWPFSLRGGNKGYARIVIKGKSFQVSRIVCEHFYGPPPTPQHEAAHLCKRNKSCVNGRHLQWKTPLENAADTLVHGTRVRGSRHYSAKLTESKVRKIRSLRGKIRNCEIAKKFGVSQQVIHRVFSGRSWSWLR